MAEQSPGGPGYRFAARMGKTQKSFIREILKVTSDPSIISFAGGLPSPDLIDVDGISAAAAAVLAEDGRNVLQYSTTEGYLPLRTFIAERYRERYGLDISPEEILITNGSQQCLDLIGKVFLDPGDHIAIERPGYLGAIQAFSLAEPVVHPVPLGDDGPDTGALGAVLSRNPAVKLFYGIPNSQNPSGITWSAGRREEVAGILGEYGTIFVEDDAYGEIRFSGEALPPVAESLPDLAVITGSFSKILSPGMRLGWICAPPPVMEKIVVAKQASDLHSNYLSQRIAARYLAENDIDAHIRAVRSAYRRQCDLMVRLIREEFPDGTSCTAPAGGMFTWVTLPPGCRSTDVFEGAIRERVAVLPGIPFYVDGGGQDKLRLNFSNSTEEKIATGIGRVARVVRSLCRAG